MARGDGDGFDGEQVAQREMQADAEHQQNDANLRPVPWQGSGRRRKPGVNERADGDAGEQVAHDRGNAQPSGKRAQDEGQRQADDNGGDQWRIVRHRGGWPPCVDAKRMVGLGEGAGRTQPLLLWKQKSRPLRQTARAYGRCFRFSRAKIGRSVLPQFGPRRWLHTPPGSSYRQRLAACLHADGRNEWPGGELGSG